MARGRSEDRESSSSREKSEELSNVERDKQKGKISEYEKQRLSRIAENKARMEALGLSKAASALLGSSPSGRKRKGRAKSGEEDDDYRPGEAGGDEDDHDDDDSEYEDEDDDDEEFLGHIRSGSGKRKVKNEGARSKKVSSKANTDCPDYIEDEEDDDDLKEAIALSLQDSVGGDSRVGPSKKKGNGKEAGSGKKKKPFVSRLQMTEDELIIYFYQFDEEGKGFVTVRDLARMAMGHDFTWAKEELQEMIRCYDSDNDGKLSLDDFRKIVTRCRMLKESDGS